MKRLGKHDECFIPHAQHLPYALIPFLLSKLLGQFYQLPFKPRFQFIRFCNYVPTGNAPPTIVRPLCQKTLCLDPSSTIFKASTNKKAEATNSFYWAEPEKDGKTCPRNRNTNPRQEQNYTIPMEEINALRPCDENSRRILVVNAKLFFLVFWKRIAQ